jgi:hypothetical protein
MTPRERAQQLWNPNYTEEAFVREVSRAIEEAVVKELVEFAVWVDKCHDEHYAQAKEQS